MIIKKFIHFVSLFIAALSCIFGINNKGTCSDGHVLNISDFPPEDDDSDEFEHEGSPCNWYEDCAIIPADSLPGWHWKEYNDGSGCLYSPDGKSYFDYDLSTHEYRSPRIKGNNWCFFSGYPYDCIGFPEFKRRSEAWITRNIIEKSEGAAN